MPAFFVPLEEIAALTQGTLMGRPDLVLTGVAGLSEAGPGDLSFVTGEAASKEATSTRAIALLVPRPIDGLACAQIVDRPGDQQGDCPRRRGLLGCGLAGDKGEIAGSRLAQPGHAGDDEIRTSHERPLCESSDLFEWDEERRHG